MQIIHHQHPLENVHSVERWASVIGGSALAISGLRHGRSGVLRALTGVAFVRRGLTGYCPAYRALGVYTSSTAPRSLDIRARAAVTVNQPRQKIFALWKQLENLPRFMSHLISVEPIDSTRSRWAAKGPGGKRVEWTAEIINEVPDKIIAWKSLPGSNVDSAGSVHFDDAPGNRGTEIRVDLQYSPPAGVLGAYVARFFGKEPEQEIRADLFRLKQYLETGEIATAQPHTNVSMGHRLREIIA